MIRVGPRLPQWVRCLITARLSAILAINLLLLSAPEVTARQPWGALWRAQSPQPFTGSNSATQDEIEVRALVPGVPIERDIAPERLIPIASTSRPDSTCAGWLINEA